jgi:hypothetical protein
MLDDRGARMVEGTGYEVKSALGILIKGAAPEPRTRGAATSPSARAGYRSTVKLQALVAVLPAWSVATTRTECGPVARRLGGVEVSRPVTAS